MVSVMDGGETKAQGLVSYVRALRALTRPDELARTMAALSAETRAFVERPPPPGVWVPIRIEDDLVRTVHEVANAGDDSRTRKLGQVSTASDFRGVYRTFVRLFSASFVVGRVGLIWHQYYRNNGSLQVLSFDNEACRGEVLYSDVVVGSHAWWQYHVGSLLGVVEVTRLKEPRVTIVDGGGAASFCRMQVTWRP